MPASTTLPHPASHQGSQGVDRAFVASPADPNAVQPARTWSVLLVLLAWCGMLFFYGLNSGDLYRTEGLRAIIAGEFLRSGNWVVPMLYGEPLLTKPPGMYAAIALVSWPFGDVQTWTARLPSALAATLTVFLFYCCFRRNLGNAAGLIAGAILPASVMWLDKASAAEIDMLQVAWVAAAIFCFMRALEIEEARLQETRRKCLRHDNEPVALATDVTTSSQMTLQETKRGKSVADASGSFATFLWWLLALICVTGGVLTKWTAPVFFYGTIVPLLWWRGRCRLLLRWPHLASLAVALALCLAWVAAVVQHTGWEPLYKTIRQEAMMRLVPAEVPVQPGLHHHRPYPWGETLGHPFLLLATMLPWSGFALLTLRPSFAALWDERGRRLLQLLHCWTWPNMVFWSVIPEHAPRHSFPLLPGIAGLAAFVWIAWYSGRWRWLWNQVSPAHVLTGMLLLWLTAKMVFVHFIIPDRNHLREPQAKAEQIALQVPAEEPLYLFRLKDEGIMFYYSQLHRTQTTAPPVRRLTDPLRLPSLAEPLYCILKESEWRQWPLTDPTQVLLRLRDEQGAPIVLVRVQRREPVTSSVGKKY